MVAAADSWHVHARLGMCIREGVLKHDGGDTTAGGVVPK